MARSEDNDDFLQSAGLEIGADRRRGRARGSRSRRRPPGGRHGHPPSITEIPDRDNGDDNLSEEHEKELYDVSGGYSSSPLSSPSFSRRQRRRRDGRSYARFSDSSDDTKEDDDGYGFNLPRYMQNNISLDDTLAPSDSSVLLDNPEVNESTVGSKLVTVHHVYQSQYTGERPFDEEPSATLTTVHSPKKRHVPPLFRWM